MNKIKKRFSYKCTKKRPHLQEVWPAEVISALSGPWYAFSPIDGRRKNDFVTKMLILVSIYSFLYLNTLQKL